MCSASTWIPAKILLYHLKFGNVQDSNKMFDLHFF